MKIKTWLIGLATAAGIMFCVVSCHQRQEQKQSLRDFDTIYTGTGPNTGTGMTLLQQAQLLNDIILELNTIGIDTLVAQDVLNLKHLVDSLNIHIDVNDTTGMLTNYARFEEVRDIIADSLAARLAAATEGASLAQFLELASRADHILSMQDIGNDIVAISTGSAVIPTSDAALSDGILYVAKIGLEHDITANGVWFCQATQGNYTADNNNRIGLYSEYNGTIRLRASCANDGNLWKATQGFTKKALSSTYAMSADSTYYVGVLYNSSAQTTAPALGKTTTVISTATLFTDNNSLGKYVSGQTDLPASVALSGMTNLATSIYWFGLY